MAKKISSPSVITAAGNKPKTIEEFIGRVNSNTTDLSIARMKSPAGWVEPGQRPKFDEYTLVINGMLRVKTENETIDLNAGETVIVSKNEWVQYSTPFEEGYEYIAVCMPAFSNELAHRE